MVMKYGIENSINIIKKILDDDNYYTGFTGYTYNSNNAHKENIQDDPEEPRPCDKFRGW